MKVLVRFAPGVRFDSFEGARLRKNIKGGLELNDIKWVDSVFADPDVCHYLSPVDVTKARDAKDDGYPVVVSALYSESDPFGCFLDRDNNNCCSLSPRSLKILELADKILVPCLCAKNLLFQCGLKNNNIEVVSPGVNLTRFEDLDALESEVFPRYYRIQKNEKYVVSVGDFEDLVNISRIKKIAEMAPNYHFFYFGPLPKGGDGVVKKLNRKSRDNLHFVVLTEDDVFRSGLCGASYFLEFGEVLSSPMHELEAMAAKTPIVFIGKTYGSEILKPGINCFAPLSVEQAANMFDSLSQLDKNTIIIEGYKTAKENSISHIGQKLKKVYETLI